MKMKGQYNFRNKIFLTHFWRFIKSNTYIKTIVQSNLALRSCLIRNKLVLRNHFLWPICHLLYKNKEHLALRNNFRVTEVFLIAKFDCTSWANVHFFFTQDHFEWQQLSFCKFSLHITIVFFSQLEVNHVIQ